MDNSKRLELLRQEKEMWRELGEYELMYETEIDIMELEAKLSPTPL